MAKAPALAVVRPQTPDEKFRAYLDAADDDIVACKASRHNMPKLKPGALPEGTEVRRQRGGAYQVTMACLDCGLPAAQTTLKGGALDPAAQWDYDYARVPGYLAPKGTGRGRKREYKTELGARVAPDIRQAAAVTASRDAAAKRAEDARRAATTPRTAKARSNTHATNPRARKNTRHGETKMQHEREQRHGGPA